MNRAWGLEISQLPPVLFRPEYFPDRHLDATGGHDLARLPADQFPASVGAGGLLQPDPQLLPGPRGRRVHRPLEPAPHDSRDPEPGYAPGCDPRRAHLDERGRRVARPASRRLHGTGQRLRHPCATGLSDPDGGRPRGPGRRHRPELVDVQRGAHGGPGDCRFSDRGRGRGDLLPAERAELRGRAGGLAGDAVAAETAGQTAEAPPSRVERRVPLRLRLPADPRDPPASGGGEPGGHAADGAPARLCHGSAPWRPGHAGPLDVVAGHGSADGGPRSGFAQDACSAWGGRLPGPAGPSAWV